MNKGRIDYSGAKVFIGIDVHIRQYTINCRSDGQVVKKCTMPAYPYVLLGFIRKYFPEAIIRTAYEAGYSGFYLHRYLMSQGIENIVVHPGAIEVSKKKVKNDKRDSAKIAEQLEAGRLTGIRVPSEEQEARRLLHRTREQLVRSRTRAMVQIRMKFHQFGLLKPDERGVLTVGKAESVLASGVCEELRISTHVLLETWKKLHEQIGILDRKLIEQAKRDRLEQIYRRVPGIGRLGARILANELGDMSEFPNERALFSYTGLTPSEHTSDEDRRLGHITREGNSRLRHILVESAWVAVRKDPSLAEDYHRIALKAGGKRAIVGIARKLIGRARALFRKKETYRNEVKLAA